MGEQSSKDFMSNTIGHKNEYSQVAGHDAARTLPAVGPTPSAHYTLFHDADRCIGCYSCEVHCKLENDVPVGPRLMRIVQIGPKVSAGKLKTAFVAMSCFHCQDAPCVAVCPTGAMNQRADGLVDVNQDICIGCKACIGGCPFGAPQYNPQTKTVIKCSYCVHRVDRGLWPSCATKCTTHCLYFGNINEISTIIRERYSKQHNAEVAHLPTGMPVTR